MITLIEAHIEAEEREGWTCPKLVGTYAITRVDGSKRDVSKRELIALLQNEADPKPIDGCPTCGQVGGAIQETDEGFTRFCGNCGPYRFVDNE